MLIRVLCFLCLIVLIGCEMPPKKEPNQIQSSQVLKQIVEKKIRQLQYPFFIQAKQEQFKGQVNGDDWFVEKDKKIRLEKKGEQIQFRKDGDKEVFMVHQIGLISPKDHLQLLNEAGKPKKEKRNISWERKRAEQLDIHIDKQKLSERIKKSFLSDQPLVLSDQVDVIYQLIYLPDTYELKKMTILIQAQKHLLQEVRYTF
ncbi:hypothetical protein [Thermoflavimicrobium dichotomicum]|uniref:Lipoprotein n=1 Tax=Thermoflavimicrobium dichotomicum TaxID=46223 RepID=A0A1I3THS9_9BACL|nr:hypothetical protein [Thermoflavimicrobium dichotomicum]SFJ69176.1 hypothetical protein SAMN05421852_11730 [Thermoflavimicrobium dichotomicum]